MCPYQGEERANAEANRQECAWSFQEWQRVQVSGRLQFYLNLPKVKGWK